MVFTDFFNWEEKLAVAHSPSFHYTGCIRQQPPKPFPNEIWFKCVVVDGLGQNGNGQVMHMHIIRVLTWVLCFKLLLFRAVEAGVLKSRRNQRF